MSRIKGLIGGMSWINEHVLQVGRAVGIFAIAIMVAVTILQVVFRYAFNNALAWPDETARFCMLWMTGLMAPTAFRRGGFVAIDVLPMMLPDILARLLHLILLGISMLVLVVALYIGWNEINGLGAKFDSASLFIPISWDFSEWYRLPRFWMMLSIPVGLVLLIMVNAELLLRSLAELFGIRNLPAIPQGDVAETGLRGVD